MLLLSKKRESIPDIPNLACDIPNLAVNKSCSQAFKYIAKILTKMFIMQLFGLSKIGPNAPIIFEDFVKFFSKLIRQKIEDGLLLNKLTLTAYWFRPSNVCPILIKDAIFECRETRLLISSTI